MATVKIDKFGGIVPRTAPSLLSDGLATVAHNCRLKSGKLVPIRKPSPVDAASHTVYHENGLESMSGAKSVYCWKHTLADGTVRTDFLAFPGRVYFAHGNIADDTYDRVFVTGDTGVSFTSSNGTIVEDCPSVYLFDRETNRIVRHCICKEPFDAPRCDFDGAVDENNMDVAFFFLSWYDKYGYESPVSAASRNKNGASTQYRENEPLKYNTDGTGSVLFQPVHVPASADGVRVYMTNNGDETESIRFLEDIGRGKLSNLQREFKVYVDTMLLGETMPEIETPPFDLIDMSYVPGNFYAGRARSMPHTVLFSDVDNPTNWPFGYRYDVRDNVVKLAVTANSVFALTDGTPYALSGTAPESMTVASLATPAACVSEDSVVVYRNVVYFASNQGLMAISDGADAGTSCTNLTDQYFTKDQWQALNPKSCMMRAYDNALHMFFQKKSGERVAYTFDLTESANALTTHEEVATCLCVDDREDKLYFGRQAR